jgi:ABC-type transporter Mla subunit MlaD
MALPASPAFNLQEQTQQAHEHEAALAGASQLQQQLADLQQQLADLQQQLAETVSSFNAEQQALREAAQQASAARECAEAAAADAQQQLAMARAVLAERLGHAEREHKQQLADLKVGTTWV